MKEYPKYLPIGTVAMLKGGKKRVMITGYAPIDMAKKDKVYDYCGCIYPEGVISTDKNILFDHDQIEKLYCIGFSDDEQKQFAQVLLNNLTEENTKKILEKINEEN